MTVIFNERLKDWIRRRDDRRCQRCKTHSKHLTRDLCVHHIDGNHLNNDHDNLISLCGKCHGQTHDCLEEYRRDKILEVTT